MIHELNKQDYEKVRPLYNELNYHLTGRAVIEGTSPGRIYVDNVSEPKTAFICSVEGYYLVGDPDNADFNQALANLIHKPQEAIRDEENAINLAVYPQNWEQHLSTLFPERAPFIEPRRKYLCTRLRVNWKELLPDGYAVHRIDRSLLERLGDNMPKHPLGWIQNNWGGRENFLKHGFGFCVLHGDRMVSWCIADCVRGDQCEVGIHTLLKYRKRGLATIAVAATVDYCFSNGYTAVGWHCSDDNVGSWKTAEKVGFVKERDYVFHLYLFDEATHWAETGWRSVKAKQYSEGVDAYTRAFARKPDAPCYWYHTAAMASAGAGDSATALSYLKTAIERGWQHLDFTQSREEFTSMQGTSEWEDILTHIQKKQEAN